MEQMNFYAEKYLNTNKVSMELQKVNTFEKRKLLFEVLHIDLTDSDFIDQAYRFAIECCDSLKWIYVYTFYVKFVSEEKKEYFLFSQGEYEKYKEQLLKKLSIDLMNFLKQLEKKALEVESELNKDEETNEFLSLKKNITNYYKCTKQFKEKFMEGLE